MTKSSLAKSDRQTQITGEYVIYWGIIWAAISLAIYLNFSVVEANAARSPWFIMATIGLEEIGLLVSGWLCLRNYRYESIVSGRAVWLLFALAMFTFFIGNLWFSAWELLWGLDPAASIGNVFFVLFYAIAIAAMRLAILDRDVQLVPQQWAIVGGVVALGLMMGCWLTTLSARAVPAPLVGSIAIVRADGSTQAIVKTSLPPIDVPAANPRQIANSPQPPAWVLAIDRSMQPLVDSFNLFYVLCDLVLLTFAAILFLGFWGGRLGLPWRMVAQAVLCFYIADTWFAYAHNRVQGYESGFIMEVFWIFGIVQFGIAAALEFDNSIRARRLARRRTAIK
ncbi:hypothetical protein [Chamaesiphon sp. VAR_69_metabat_338]|uniref:hypothetical protein n=1 Tax=Chamaesiphon sp. VAR_69_metabat_338 TaxID=2964704 RepID=UPI00286E7678|nr:hypothetical protein [Chamaesiphon sp. VAR_69_metabat_338]